MKLSSAIEDYLYACRAESKTAKTISVYKLALDNFLAFLKDIEVETLEPKHVRQFVANELDRRGKNGEKLSTASVHKYYSVLRSFIRWMYDQRMIKECLTDRTKAPKMNNELPSAMTDAEVKRLFDYLRDMGNFRNLVIFELFLDTGCRLEEVSKLNLEDVHLEEGWIKVFGKGRKEGIVPIGKKLTSDLHSYIVRYRENDAKEGETSLFVNRMGERLDREGLSMLVRRVLGKVRTDSKSKHGAHTLRHTMATTYLRNGGDLETLRRILRHNDIKTTQRYVNLLTQDVLNSHRKASPLDNLEL